MPSRNTGRLSLPSAASTNCSRTTSPVNGISKSGCDSSKSRYVTSRMLSQFAPPPLPLELAPAKMPPPLPLVASPDDVAPGPLPPAADPEAEPDDAPNLLELSAKQATNVAANKPSSVNDSNR